MTNATKTRKGAFISSLFFKTAALVVVSSLVVGLTISGMSALAEQKLALADQRRLIETIAGTIENAIARPVQFGDKARANTVLDQAFAEAPESIRGIVVLNAKGDELTRATDGFEDETAQAAWLAGQALEVETGVSSDDGLQLARPIQKADGTVIGAYGLYSDATDRLAAVHRNMAGNLLAGLIVMLLAVTVTILLMRRMMVTPLNRLSDVLADMTEGNYDHDLKIAARRDEIGRIATNLQRLTGTLQEGRRAEEQRRHREQERAEVTEQLGKALTAIANGRLGFSLTEPFPDAYESLRENYNRAAENMRAAIADVADAAQRIKSGAGEMTRATDDLSKRTEHQAATLEQTAAALDELASSVRSTADGSRDVENTVRDANRLVEENAAVMRKAVEAMANIEKSSTQIGEIITLIDDIAFQTNLLALNAGVEAARAGAAGKGFAVVASEVRALAQRSSEAARQIGDLISGSAEEVKTGAGLVGSAGETLNDVVTQVTRISQLMSDIANGAAEQATGVHEINTGVTNLDRVTQQNAAMAEEANAATQMLFEDAGRLAELVSAFSIDDNSPAPAPGAKPDLAA